MIACGPKVKPDLVPAEPEPVAKGAPRPLRGAGTREVVVGEMCPQGAAGRPAITPLVMRTVGWNENAGEVVAMVERGSVPRFVVFGTDGKAAGVFDTLGIVDVGPQQSVATGTYVGSPPCSYEINTKPTPGQLATRADDNKCAAATGGCGLAAGEITHPDEPPEVPSFPTGGACLSGDQLAIDIDGDGRIESFPLAGVLDGIRGPAAEWTAAPTAAATCTPQFQIFDIKLVPEPDPGKPVDPKSIVMMDVLGVVDLDGDGKKELVLALRFPTVRSIVVYTATTSAQRLELGGEGTTIPH